MENKIKRLFNLQLIDIQLDELEMQRGDLPGRVKELEYTLEANNETIEEKRTAVQDARSKKEENTAEMERLNENQKKFNAQLFNVRNNREYDALTKEIDFCSSQIKKLEAENEHLIGSIQEMEKEIEELTPKNEELKAALDEKQKELDEIIRINQAEESRLQQARLAALEGISQTELTQYARIRKSKRGKAIVAVNRGACGGCQSVIPSNRQLEIRKNNKIYSCENCGRMLISAELAKEVKEN